MDAPSLFCELGFVLRALAAWKMPHLPIIVLRRSGKTGHLSLVALRVLLHGWSVIFHYW